MPTACGFPSASIACCSPRATPWRSPLMSSPPTVRAEYLREQVEEHQFGVINKPLTPWERIYGNTFLRKAAILVVLAAAWQAYAMYLDNSLVLPTFLDTVKAFVQRMESGELVRKSWVSIK